MSSEVNNGLAIPLALVGNAINSIGYIIQKQAHMIGEAKMEKWNKEQEEKRDRASLIGVDKQDDGVKDDNSTTIKMGDASPPPNAVRAEDYPTINCLCNTIPSNHFLVTPLWWLGIFLYGIGSAIHGAALSYGSHTIIAPMDAFTLVCNAIFAPIFLSEVFTMPQIIGTGILIIGIAGIAVSAPSDPPAFESGRCFDMIGQERCLATLCGWGGATIVMYVGRRIHIANRDVGASTDSSKANGVVEMLALCLMCAFFGSLCQLSLKCFFSQLSFIPEVLTEGSNFYFITFFFITSMLLLEVWRQRALKNFDALFVIPIICALLLSGSVVVGGICFNEFDVLTSVESTLLSISVCICILGVLVTAYKGDEGEEVLEDKSFKVRRKSMIMQMKETRDKKMGWQMGWGTREVEGNQI